MPASCRVASASSTIDQGTSRECCLLFILNIFQVFLASLFPQCPTILPGYTVDRCLLAPLSEDEGETGETTSEKRHLVIPFQNEFLYPAYKHEAGKSKTGVICTVPDLISVLGEDGEAIGSQELRYGLKVVVIGMPAHPLWTGDERGSKMQTWPWVWVTPLGTIFYRPGYHPGQLLLGIVPSIKNRDGKGG